MDLNFIHIPTNVYVRSKPGRMENDIILISFFDFGPNFLLKMDYETHLKKSSFFDLLDGCCAILSPIYR